MLPVLWRFIKKVLKVSTLNLNSHYPLWVMAGFFKNHTVKLSFYMYAHSH